MSACAGAGTARAADDLSAWSDEFNDPSTLSTWQRTVETEGWGNDVLQSRDLNSSRPGWLRLVPHSSTWYQEWRGELMFKLVTGDFVITTEVEPRNRQGTGAPEALFSLGGLMVRAPRTMTSPAEWTPAGQNYVFLSLGTGTALGTYQYEVKTTVNSVSTLLLDPGVSRATLQVARIGPHCLMLRRDAGGEWVVHRRYFRPDFPATLQAGLTVYSDWSPCEAVGYAWHNTHVLTNGAPRPGGGLLSGAGADLRADFDYVRFARPVVPAALVGANLSDSAAVSDNALLEFLGDHAQSLPTAQDPPSIDAQPTSRAVLTGANTTFTVAAHGPGTLRYQWWKGVSLLSGATGVDLARLNVQSGDAGDYRVVVANAWGAVTSQVAQLEVLPAPPTVTTDTNPAVIAVSTTVVAPAPERFGFNLQVPELNNYTIDPGFEPTVIRRQFVATGGDADYIENSAGPTTSYYQTLTNGFFDGASVRIYRPRPDGPVQWIRDALVTHYAVDENRVYLDGPGPVVEAGDYYFLKLLAIEPPRDRLDPRMTFARGNDPWRPVGGGSWPYGLAVEVTRDGTTMAPENGGYSSLRLQAPGAHEVSIRQARFSSPASYGGYYPQLVAGRRYRIEVWLRQTGIPDGQARVFLTQHYTEVSGAFVVGADWQKFSHTFIAPPTPVGTEGIAEVCLAFTGPGTLWADNFVLYEDEDQNPNTYPAFAVRPEAYQAMADYRPGPVRLWAGQANGSWGTSLESLTGMEILQQNTWNADQGKTPRENAYTLPTALPLVQSIGGTPWIIVSPGFCENEWRGLIEYLAAPYDPSIDTPQTKPWAARRYAQGRVAPWSEAFPRWRFEFGNETWNSLFQFTYPNGALAGQFAEYFFRVAQTSPWFESLASKTDFIVNGWILQPTTDGYGHAAAARSPLARFSDITGYLSGWELGSNYGSNITEVAFQDMLLFPAGWLRHFVDRHATTRDQVVAGGRDYHLAVYEGGPGYPLPGPGQEYDPVAEAYGKSLAAGTATLDAFLYNSTRGIDPQAYFTFGAGANWYSHTNSASGWRAHPAWLALQMRNQLARGDLVNAAVMQAPVTEIPASNADGNAVPAFPNTPWVTAYAFREGTSYTVFVLSRRLDRTTPVTLRLPFTQATSVLQHALTGDPRANNISSHNLGVTTTPLNFTGPEFQFELPPASVFAFEFGGATTPVETNPSVVITRALGQATPTVDPWGRFLVHFSQPITGLTPDDFGLSGGTGASEVSVRELPPHLGTDFEITVSGLRSPGLLNVSLPAGAAVTSQGVGNTLPIYLDAALEYAPLPPEDRLLGEESFGLAPSAAPEPPFLNGVNTGTGWAQPWQVQNFGPGYVGGFRLDTNAPLTFADLVTAGSHAVGGHFYETASRLLAVDTAFANFTVPGRTPAVIGRDGRDLWVAVLLRKDTAQFGSDGPFVNFVDDVFAWNFGAAQFALGYFGGPSISGGVPYWTLGVRQGTGNDFDYVRSSVPVVVGQTALLVARLQFGTTDRIDLFVNPPTLGGAAPAQPNATWTASGATPNLAFRAVGFYGGPSTTLGQVEGSFDELRLGETFAAVTPRPTSAWETWRTGIAWPTAAAAESTADPDGDGASNLEEYATGSDPLTSNPPGYPALVEFAGQLRISFPLHIGARGVATRVELSSDLSLWTEAARFTADGSALVRDTSSTTTHVAVTGEGAVRTVTESVDLTGVAPGGFFVRLRFELIEAP